MNKCVFFPLSFAQLLLASLHLKGGAAGGPLVIIYIFSPSVERIQNVTKKMCRFLYKGGEDDFGRGDGGRRW